MTDSRITRRSVRMALGALTVLLSLALAAPETRAFGIRERNEQNSEPPVEEARQTDRPERTAGRDDGDPEPGDDPVGNADEETAADDEADEAPDEADDEAPDDDESAVTEDEPAADDDESPDLIAIEDIFFDIHRAPIALPESMTARDLAVQIEADRRLLAELRKEIPFDRAEAELYLRRIRELAAISDPVALVPVANNVIRQAPALFEWLETEYDDPDERARDYYIGGSWAFHRRFEAFRKAVLLTVIRRLDAIGYILEGDQE